MISFAEKTVEATENLEKSIQRQFLKHECLRKNTWKSFKKVSIQV